MATTSERLKEALEIRNMKPADLSRASGIGKSAISQYLVGKYAPKQDKIYKMARALTVDAAWLMGLDVPMVDTSLKRVKYGMEKYQLFMAALKLIGWDLSFLDNDGDPIGADPDDGEVHYILTNGTISFEVKSEDLTNMKNGLVDYITSSVQKLMVEASKTIGKEQAK